MDLYYTLKLNKSSAIGIVNILSSFSRRAAGRGCIPFLPVLEYIRSALARREPLTSSIGNHL